MQTLKLTSSVNCDLRIVPRWRGKNLAVHCPETAGQFIRKRAEWSITHVHSGLRAGIFHGSLVNAIWLAKYHDAHFAGITPENVHRELKYKEEWIKGCQLGIPIPPGGSR